MYGPELNTRYQWKGGTKGEGPSGTASGKAGRSWNASVISPAYTMTVRNGIEYIELIGLWNDRSDESIVSFSLGELAAESGIGRLNSIDSPRLQVALNPGDNADTLRFTELGRYLKRYLIFLL